MALGGDLPLGEVLSNRGRGKDLTGVKISVDLQKHEFAALVEVLHLSDEGDVVGVDRGVSLDGGLIRDRVFVLSISSVEDTSDLTGYCASIVLSKILEIKGHPSAVDKDAASLTLIIQVGIEWSNNLNTLLAVLHLLNLNLLGVVEHASHLDLLEREIALELVNALLSNGPWA